MPRRFFWNRRKKLFLLGIYMRCGLTLRHFGNFVNFSPAARAADPCSLRVAARAAGEKFTKLARHRSSARSAITVRAGAARRIRLGLARSDQLCEFLRAQCAQNFCCAAAASASNMRLQADRPKSRPNFLGRSEKSGAELGRSGECSPKIHKVEATPIERAQCRPGAGWCCMVNSPRPGPLRPNFVNSSRAPRAEFSERAR